MLDERIAFFAENSEMNITTTLKEFGNNYTVTGSKNQDVIKDYDRTLKRYNDKNLDLIKKELEAVKNGEDSLVKSYQKQRQKLVSGKYLAIVNFAMNHKDYEVSPYLMITEASDINVKYLDTVYNSLTPRVKDSKYGKELKSFIERKNNTIAHLFYQSKCGLLFHVLDLQL